MTFVKGKSGNPYGRPAIPPELRQLAKLTSEQATRDILECYNTKLGTLRTMLDDDGDSVSGGLAMIAKAIVVGVESGDIRILTMFLDRILGKAPESSLQRDVDTSQPNPEIESVINRLLDMVHYQNGQLMIKERQVVESKTDPDQKVIDEK